ncbi:Aspartate--ammonia ligase [Cucumispora dikerogammari]|nr:Aspartate--ammonia ligase [Cucumispora dikerogammari]
MSSIKTTEREKTETTVLPHQQMEITATLYDSKESTVFCGEVFQSLTHFTLIKQVDKANMIFSEKLVEKMNLQRVPAPLFVSTESSINDPLNNEIPVFFKVKTGQQCEIVHSLAKWKRCVLQKLGLMKSLESGIYCDMNAARIEEDLSPIHSFLVDQWDWELPIKEIERTEIKLQSIVRKIYTVIRDTKRIINGMFGLKQDMPDDISFITTQELEFLYPFLTPKEREHAIAKEHKAVFIMGIGHNLKSGKPHDLRAADYDDWNLNGDIIVWHEKLQSSIELSSMGIRVDSESLQSQMKIKKTPEYIASKPYYMNIKDGKLGSCIGGGIGKSRTLMFLLERTHIAEVQSGFWPIDFFESMEKKDLFFL